MCTIHPLNCLVKVAFGFRGNFPPSGQSHGRQLGHWLTSLRRIGILQDSWTDKLASSSLDYLKNQKEMASYLSNKNCIFEQNGWRAFFFWVFFWHNSIQKMAWPKSEWLEIVPKFLLQHAKHGDPRISLRCWVSRKPGKPGPCLTYLKVFKGQSMKKSLWIM